MRLQSLLILLLLMLGLTIVVASLREKFWSAQFAELNHQLATQTTAMKEALRQQAPALISFPRSPHHADVTPTQEPSETNDASQLPISSQAFEGDLISASTNDSTRGLAILTESYLAQQRKVALLENNVSELTRQLKVTQDDLDERDLNSARLKPFFSAVHEWEQGLRILETYDLRIRQERADSQPSNVSATPPR